MQIDALKEIINVGGGNAATALSKILSIMVDMKVPDISFLTYDEVFTQYYSQDEPVVCTSVGSEGDISGNFLLVCTKEEADRFVGFMMGSETDCLSEIGESAFKELGNIIISSYLNALSQFTELRAMSTVPSFVYDMFGACLTSAYISMGQIDEYVMVIRNIYLNDNKSVNISLFFIPEVNILEKIFNKFGIV
jgi:chemotaxis protein CheC